MDSNDDLYCNRVIRYITKISEAVLLLHGRDTYNMFGLYGEELQKDIQHLVVQRYMDCDLQPLLFDDVVMLPGMALRNSRRLRHIWDYFVFTSMSHKIQNIKRRPPTSGESTMPFMLYLRGADYQLAIARKGTAVGYGLAQDTLFGEHILAKLKDRFNIVKAFSPSDMTWAMKHLDAFLALRGNFLSTVAEFARAWEAGLFLNPAKWKDRILDLYPSTSLFLVYVSNQSNGLSHELQSLVDQGLVENSILVLDNNRFGSRKSFFLLQDQLKNLGQDLYLSVDRNACAVEDPDVFEQLVSRFPHQVIMGDDTEKVVQEIEALIPIASRLNVAPPMEFPFEFEICLAPEDKVEVDALRNYIHQFIEQSLSQDTVYNWPVLLLYIELDIFLNLSFGDILKAAISSARYGAIADFTRERIRMSAPERIADLDPILRQCGNIRMNVAYDAFALGEWNDFSDRRELAKLQIDAVADQVITLMRNSCDQAGAIILREPKADVPRVDPAIHVELTEILDNAVLNAFPTDSSKT